MPNVKLMLGDCIDKMQEIPDNSVDLVLTDPPYNISRANNFNTMGRGGIDFGEWDKNVDILSYIREVSRVVSRNGSFIVFNDWKNLGDISKYAESIGFTAKDMLRLEKTNPMPRNRDRRYVTDYECAIWFVKDGAKWVFNRLDKAYQRPKFVHSVERGLHPTQKSLPLMMELCKIHSNIGDTVLDCFMGSGTTGVACVKTGRNFIGIEKDAEYFSVAENRISIANGTMPLDKSTQ